MTQATKNMLLQKNCVESCRAECLGEEFDAWWVKDEYEPNFPKTSPSMDFANFAKIRMV
jgi:hypothetical protein